MQTARLVSIKTRVSKRPPLQQGRPSLAAAESRAAEAAVLCLHGEFVADDQPVRQGSQPARIALPLLSEQAHRNAPSSPVHAAHSRSGSFLTNAQVISTPPRLLGSSEFSSFDLPR